MSFNGTCTICTDYFDLDSDISCTFCGHLFHSICLNQWIKTCGTQKTCPQCRTRITSRQVVNKIYVNTPEDANKELDPCRLKNKLDEADTKIKQVESKNADLKSVVACLEDAELGYKEIIQNLKNELKSERSKMCLLKSDMTLMKQEVAEARLSEREVKRLKSQLRLLEKVEILLNGQKHQVDAMLEQYTNSNSSIPQEMKQLATFCVALKQEYESVKESKRKYNAELMKLRREMNKKDELLVSKLSMIENLEKANLNYQNSEDALIEENRSLQRKVKSLQDAIISPRDSKSSAVSRLLSESPAPEFLTPCDPSRTKRLIPKDTPLSIKKPRLSASFDESSEDLFIGDENMPATSACKSESCSQNLVKVMVHASCKDIDVNTAKTTVNANQNYAAIIRRRLVNSRISASAGCDGYGGQKKRIPQLKPRHVLANKNTGIKFSSVTSSNFKVTGKNSYTDKFARLKRLGPK